MKLTDLQIEELFIFTRQHYVEWYDVQMELVDHLANDIEAIWQKEPNLGFTQARDKSFKKFGIFGFMDVIEKRTGVLEKKYWKMVWVILKKFFKVPQIILTLVIFLGIYETLTLFPNEYTIPILGLVCFAVLIVRLIILGKQKKKRFIQTQKKWMLEEHIYRLGKGGLFLNLVLQISLRVRYLSSDILIFSYAILFTIVILVVYIISFILPAKIEEILIKEHPEYLFVTNT